MSRYKITFLTFLEWITIQITVLDLLSSKTVMKVQKQKERETSKTNDINVGDKVMREILQSQFNKNKWLSYSSQIGQRMFLTIY